MKHISLREQTGDSRVPFPGLFNCRDNDLPKQRDTKADLMAQARCMIVEDQVLIGMSLEASLEEAGFVVEGPFMSSAQALHWLESNTPDIALLDVMIKEGTSVEIARELKSRGIPFAIYSGLPPKKDSPPELQDVPWLVKPVSREALTATLGELVVRPHRPEIPESGGRLGG